MTLADVLLVLRGGNQDRIAEAHRCVETWFARAELVRDLDDAAIQFARRGSARFAIERDAARAATERATREQVAAEAETARWVERVRVLEAKLAAIRAEVA